MKKFINKIRRSIMVIVISLRCCFIICKSLILYYCSKISKIDLEMNMFEAIEDSIFKAYWCDLIDDNEFDKLTDILNEVLIDL